MILDETALCFLLLVVFSHFFLSDTILATINQAPELFKVAILGVPFVDVVPTMIDASIPLTVVEWEEWGNPNEEKYHQYMMEYSPTQNVVKGAKYPACLLTGGLHDPRVQYWEPAKVYYEYYEFLC